MGTLAFGARAVAQDLLDVWTAFERFCRQWLGVGAATMLNAWQMPLLADVEQMLRRYADVKPDPAKADLYYGYLCGTWDRKFGAGGEDGE